MNYEVQNVLRSSNESLAVRSLDHLLQGKGDSSNNMQHFGFLMAGSLAPTFWPCLRLGSRGMTNSNKEEQA
jgi:hypothetical protein